MTKRESTSALPASLILIIMYSNFVIGVKRSLLTAPTSHLLQVRPLRSWKSYASLSGKQLWTHNFWWNLYMGALTNYERNDDILLCFYFSLYFCSEHFSIHTLVQNCI